MSKNVTPTIAKALAEEVSKQLVKTINQRNNDLKLKIKETKEYKQLLKLVDQRDELSDKIRTLAKEITNKHQTSLTTISFDSSYTTIYSSYSSNLTSVDSIKNRIFITDYLNGTNVSLENIMDAIILDIMNLYSIEYLRL
jgi:hypothetical protein